MHDDDETRPTSKGVSRNILNIKDSQGRAESKNQESVFRSDNYLPKSLRVINRGSSNKKMSKNTSEQSMSKDFWQSQVKPIKNGPAILDRLFD
jgi:hypothetical protein